MVTELDWYTPTGQRRTPEEAVMHERLLAWDIRPDEHIVLLGGYSGVLAQYLADRYPKAELHVYEPQPALAKQLQARFALYAHVHVYDCALGSQSGDFGMCRLGTDAASFILGELAQKGPAELNGYGFMVEFGVAMKRSGVDRIALLHCNIEQYEWELIAHLAAFGWWEERIEQFCVQVHESPSRFSDLPDAAQWDELTTECLSHRLVWDEREKFSWQGWAKEGRKVPHL